MVLLTNQLEQKVLNDNTVFVYPNTPQKLREYQELVVKGFYLANADVKQTANMIRTMVKTRDIFIDEKINLLVLKDTPAAFKGIAAAAGTPAGASASASPAASPAAAPAALKPARPRRSPRRKPAAG